MRSARQKKERRTDVGSALQQEKRTNVDTLSREKTPTKKPPSSPPREEGGSAENYPSRSSSRERVTKRKRRTPRAFQRGKKIWAHIAYSSYSDFGKRAGRKYDGKTTSKKEEG